MGSLSVLKNLWTEKKEALHLDTFPMPNYLKKLKKQLEEVGEMAKMSS